MSLRLIDVFPTEYQFLAPRRIFRNDDAGRQGPPGTQLCRRDVLVECLGRLCLTLGEFGSRCSGRRSQPVAPADGLYSRR